MPKLKPFAQALIACFLLSMCPVMLQAAEESKKENFNPQLYNEENLPPGIIYMITGPVDGFPSEGIVVGDIFYPRSKIKGFYYPDGKKATINALYKGKTVVVYANEKHEAVYVVLK